MVNSKKKDGITRRVPFPRCGKATEPKWLTWPTSPHLQPQGEAT